MKYAKLTWIQLALGSTNSRYAGMNPKGKGKSSTATLTTAQYLNAGFAPQVSSSTDKRDTHSKARLKKRIADLIDKDCILVVFSHLISGGNYPRKSKKLSWKFNLYKLLFLSKFFKLSTGVWLAKKKNKSCMQWSSCTGTHEPVATPLLEY